MKTLFKLGLVASTLLTAATSAYAFTPTPTMAIHQVPEPSALGLLGLSLVVLALVKRKK